MNKMDEERIRAIKLTEDDLFLIVYYEKEITINEGYGYIDVKLYDEILAQLTQLEDKIVKGEYPIPWYLLNREEASIVYKIDQQIKALAKQKADKYILERDKEISFTPLSDEVIISYEKRRKK